MQFDCLGVYTPDGSPFMCFEDYECETGIPVGLFRALAERGFQPGDSEDGLTFLALREDGVALFEYNGRFIELISRKTEYWEALK